jgi:cytochrome c peroxidase
MQAQEVGIRIIAALISLFQVAGSYASEQPAEASLGKALFHDVRFTRPQSEHCLIEERRRGQQVSCASCHQDRVTGSGGAARGAGFAEHVARSARPSSSPVDLVTARNASSLLDALEPTDGVPLLLHWDGEFATAEELVRETFLGLNFGWTMKERSAAIRHFASVIRNDQGAATNDRAGSYPTLLRASYGLDVASATDEKIMSLCARLVVSYLQELRFARDAEGLHSASPYDAFLAANRLPRAPGKGEPAAQYARRLHNAVASLNAPRFINDPSRKQAVDGRPFRFDELELAGMRIFFRGTMGYVPTAKAGNCAECHVPPRFTDGLFHNTGASQEEYDGVHGAGAFTRLQTPGLIERIAAAGRWLPPSLEQPDAVGIYRAAASKSQPDAADLGAWNIYANPAMPRASQILRILLDPGRQYSDAEVLERSLARFKTPSLRNISDTAPYLHNGSAPTIEAVLDFYRRMSDLAREGKLRNAPLEYAGMKLEPADTDPLAAFLRSLNEDYAP